MKASTTTARRRSARLSTGAPSSQALTDRHDSSPRDDRDSSSRELTANKKSVPDIGGSGYFPDGATFKPRKASPTIKTPVNKKPIVPELGASLRLQTDSGSPSFRSRGSRSSIGSISSFSTTGSSKKGDNIFDTPVCTPQYDSNLTSPEVDACSPCDGRATNKSSDSLSCQWKDDEIVRHLAKKTSQLSVSCELPVIARQRSISVPSSAFPSKRSNGSSLYDNDDCLTVHFKKLSLDNGNDAELPVAGRKASSKTRTKLGIEHNIKAFSATGRIEENTPSGVGRRRETTEQSMASGDMDWEASPVGGNLESEEKLRPDSPARSRKKSVATQQNLPTMHIDSPKPSTLGIVAPTDSPKPGERSRSIQQRGVEDLSQHNVHSTPGERFSVDNHKAYVEEEEQLDADLPTAPRDSDDGADYPITDEPTPGVEGTSGIEAILDAGDLSEVVDASEAVDVSDRNIVSPQADHPQADRPQGDHPQGDHPQGDRPHEPFPADAAEEPIHLERYNDKFLTKRDIQMNLIDIIRGKKQQGTLTQENQASGFIYVYTSSAFMKSSGTESEIAYEYFKMGLSKKNPQKRIAAQKNCAPSLFTIEDGRPQKFRCAKLVERLVQCELCEFRRKYACKTEKNDKGEPREHGEWFQIDQQRLLKTIEKWRNWITENDPYTSEGVLRPRWVWKIDKLERGKDDIDIDGPFQLFTKEEELLYQKYLCIEMCKEFYRQGMHFHKGLMSSTLFLAVIIVLCFLIYNLGVLGGVICFVFSAVALAKIFSG